MRQDNEQASFESGLLEALLQAIQVQPNRRPDISVHDGCRDALVFLDLGQHVARSRDVESGQLAPDTLDRGNFVRRITICMQKADRHGSHTRIANGFDGTIKQLMVKRRKHFAVRPQALVNSKAQLARHKGFGRRRAQIITVTFESLAHFDDVAVTLGRQQRNPGALSLKERIRRNSRAVNQPMRRSEHRGS